jgi:monoamine oxidase
MARTPLMSRLLHLVADFHQAEARGISVEQLRDERRLGISRRDFLKTTGVAAVGLSLARPASVPGTANASGQPRIGIMGAGIAGLSAALRLQDKGLASAVFESSTRIGGRMHSDSTGYWRNGQTSEWCGELIDSNFKTIMSLAQRFNLPLVDMLAAQPQGSQDTYYVHGHYYLFTQALQDFVPVSQVLRDQLKQAPFPTVYNSSTPFGKYLDHLSVHDWIEQYVPGGHSSDFGELLDSAYNQEFGLDTPSQSSLNLVYLLGFQPVKQPAGGFAWYGTSDERFHIFGGNQQLPLAIASQIQNASPACTIRLGWKMTAISVNADRSIACSFSTPSGSQRQAFDEVILTMPFSVLRGLDYSGAEFDTLKQTAIAQLGYGTNTKMNLQFNSRFWNGTGAWPGTSDGTIYTDLAFENSWEATRAQPGATGIIALYTGGSFGTAIVLPQPYMTTSDSPKVTGYVQQYLQQLETIWPGAPKQWNGQATVSTPWSDPNLLGSYACWKVGQYTSFSGYEGVRQGNVHFAGEHCSINFQGFMEGGAQEGIRAANEILTDNRIPI